jgi:hypothetical protein
MKDPDPRTEQWVQGMKREFEREADERWAQAHPENHYVTNPDCEHGDVRRDEFDGYPLRWRCRDCDTPFFPAPESKVIVQLTESEWADLPNVLRLRRGFGVAREGQPTVLLMAPDSVVPLPDPLAGTMT